MKKLVTTAIATLMFWVLAMQAHAGLDLRFTFDSRSPFFSGSIFGTVSFEADPTLGVDPFEDVVDFADSITIDSFGPTSGPLMLQGGPVVFDGFSADFNSFTLARTSASSVDVVAYDFLGESGAFALCLTSFPGDCSNDDLGNPLFGFIGPASLLDGQAADEADVGIATRDIFAEVPAPASLPLMLLGLVLVCKTRSSRAENFPAH